MPNTYETREGWLQDATAAARQIYEKLGWKIPPNIRVACGFPSVGGRSGLRRQTLGECWAETASKDGTWEILISPTLAEPTRVLDVLFHELTHATVGLEEGHKGAFKTLALAVGLTGKMTATQGGDKFKRIVAPMLESLGPYPHAELDTRGYSTSPNPDEPQPDQPQPEHHPRLSSGPKRQGTRLLKVMCPKCGYLARVTLKWLNEVGPPRCANLEHGAMARQS
jgi:hypothetical protein